MKSLRDRKLCWVSPGNAGGFLDSLVIVVFQVGIEAHSPLWVTKARHSTSGGRDGGAFMGISRKLRNADEAFDGHVVPPPRSAPPYARDGSPARSRRRAGTRQRSVSAPWSLVSAGWPRVQWQRSFSFTSEPRSRSHRLSAYGSKQLARGTRHCVGCFRRRRLDRSALDAA